MNIRKYTESDIEKVVLIFRSNIPKYFSPEEEPGLRNFLDDIRSTEYLVVEKNNEIIGSGGIALNADETVSLCWGMVRNDFIGKGLGKRLTEFRINLSRENFGSRPIVISTSQHTQEFYEKFGFKLTEHIPDGFAPGIDNCKMRLEF
jgi:predicted GNAT family N-acyltransferase